MVAIKESLITTAKKTITAELAIENGTLMIKTEESDEFYPLSNELEFFNGKLVKMAFVEDTKFDSLTPNEEE